jgi:hypothetical protein
VLLGALVLGAGAALHARRRSDGGAWLGLYALSALGMLIAAPIVWTHYFLVMLCGRPRLLLWGGLAFNAALLLPPLRALGFHMACALALYAWIAWGLWSAAPLRQPASPIRPAASSTSAEGSGTAT